MKPVTIAVLTKEAGLAADLARGLAERGSHFVIETVTPEQAENWGMQPRNGPEKYYEVLVTDYEEKDGLRGCFEPSRVVLTGENPCRISDIHGKIMEAAGQPEGSLRLVDEQAARVVEFGSFWGGSGVTSLAVAAGRMLAGAYGERVLYVPFTQRDGSLDYRCISSEGIREPGRSLGSPVRELAYRLKNRRPVFWQNFSQSDDYSLDYLWCGREKNELLELEKEEQILLLEGLKLSGEYDWIFVDRGNGILPAASDIRIAVDSQQDCRRREIGRTESGVCGLEILVVNHGLENRKDAAASDAGETMVSVELIHDGESFLSGADGQTEIIMSKSYAVGIKIFSELLLEMVSNPAESW